MGCHQADAAQQAAWHSESETTVASSMPSSRSCDLEHLGAIYRKRLASTVPATGSSVSSIGSSNVAGWRRVTISLPPITLPSSSLRQSDYGCALMSPRPSTTVAFWLRCCESARVGGG